MRFLWTEIGDEEGDILARAWVQMLRSYRRQVGQWPAFYSFWRDELRQSTMLLMAESPVELA